MPNHPDLRPGQPLRCKASGMTAIVVGWGDDSSGSMRPVALSHFNRLRHVLRDCLGVEESKVTEEARLIDDLGADSLDSIALQIAIEEEFNVVITDDAIPSLITVRDLFDRISRVLVA